MKYLSEVPGVSTSVHDWKPVTPKDFLDALHRYATVCSATAPGEHGNEGMAGVSPWAFKLDRKTTATVWYMPKRGKAPDVVSSPCLLTIAREDGSVICFESLNHGLDRNGKPWHATDRIVTHVAPGQAAAPLETGEVDAPHRTVSPGALALDTAKTIFGDAEPAVGPDHLVLSWQLGREARAALFADLKAIELQLSRMDAPSAQRFAATFAAGTGGLDLPAMVSAVLSYVDRVAEYGYRTRAQQAELDALKGMLERKGEPDAAGELTARYSGGYTGPAVESTRPPTSGSSVLRPEPAPSSGPVPEPGADD